MPSRLQRKRTKGYRLPPGTVCVTRPGPWGNVFTVAEAQKWGVADPKQAAVDAFRWWLMFDRKGMELAERARAELRRKSLACYCKPATACHADVLLDAAAGKLWDGWRQVGKKLVRVRRHGRKYHASVHDMPAEISPFHFGRTYSSPVPRILRVGISVLGDWPDEDAAFEAAKFVIDGIDQPRVCTPRDIDRVRRENRERARA